MRYALTAAPTIVNQWTLPHRPDQIYGRIAAGANFAVTSGLSVQLQGLLSVSQDQGNDMGGFLGVRLRM